MTERRHNLLLAVAMAVSLSSAPAVHAQVLAGENPPGGVTNFNITVPEGVTNLAISVAGSPTAFSHLRIQPGVAPTETAYALAATLDGQTNAINLEWPELRVTNYVLQVHTPAYSLTHGFAVTLVTNGAAWRTVARPASKPLTWLTQGTLGASNWHYFRVDIPSNSPPAGWWLTLTASAKNPDLYVQRGSPPTTDNWLRRSLTNTNDVIRFEVNERTPGTYFIGVYQVSGSNAYTLSAGVPEPMVLAWDSGVTDAGTQAYTNQTMSGGDYFFKITTQSPAVGAWRTALHVLAGEADVYLQRGAIPSVASYTNKSDRAGSDGFVRAATDFKAGEDWYLMVRSHAGSVWRLVSGDPFVTDLGNLAADDTSGSGDFAVGPEGYRFFKTSISQETRAWRLWLNGAAHSLLVKSNGVPLEGKSDFTAAGQMLLVPPQFVAGQQYFVGIKANPSTVLALDSRQQAVIPLDFGGRTSVTNTGFGYTTFQVTVPVGIMGWQVSLDTSEGNPNFAIRRANIPNENNSDAFSEVPGLVKESVSLVPRTDTPSLSDGTYYITVYGTNHHSLSLENGSPEALPMAFEGVVTNTDPGRVGWRFYQLLSSSFPPGVLGWDLRLENSAPGTRIVLRRGYLPGLWQFRTGSTTKQDATATDYDAVGWLQIPDMPVDNWYVGIYNPDQPLGAYRLITRPLAAEPLPSVDACVSRTNVPPEKWEFFQVNVPATAVGWDLRLTNVSGGLPKLVVRRGQLPASLGSVGLTGNPLTTDAWPPGNQRLAGPDWTERDFSADGSASENGRVMTWGMGRPLQAGTYYVGIKDSVATNTAISYTLVSRGIGDGFAIPVQRLAFDGPGSIVTNSGLAARDLAVYRVDIPSNTPSWKLRLSATSGDSLLAIAKDALPNITASSGSSVTAAQTAGKKMRKAGDEWYVQLPTSAGGSLPAGSYYLVVVSEGMVSAVANRIGTGVSSYVLQSLGMLPIQSLGRLTGADIVVTNEIKGGEVVAYSFSLPPPSELLGAELFLEDRSGNPWAVLRTNLALPDPGSGGTAESYGNEGGLTTGTSSFSDLFTLAYVGTNGTTDLPVQMVVMARGQSGVYPDARFRLRLRKIVPETLSFDGFLPMQVTNSPSGNCYFRVDVPPNAQGWDLRIVDVLNGTPILGVARDVLPLGGSTSGLTDSRWDSGDQWWPTKDWTQRSKSASGINEEKRILACGMGRPLSPGTYYVSIKSSGGEVGAPVCSLLSRGIGEGFSIPVHPLEYTNGRATNSALLPREAAYYRVLVPSNAASWKLRLTVTRGEAMLMAVTNFNVLPNSDRSVAASGKVLQKIGDEHFVMLPAAGQSFLRGGTNYLAVISEGENPTDKDRVGTNSVSYVLESLGELPVTDLGILDQTDVWQTNTLQGGEIAAYRFTVPPNIPSLEVQLFPTSGQPVAVLGTNAALPNPGAAWPNSVTQEPYGFYAGAANVGGASTNRITLANPGSGAHSLVVMARSNSTSGSYSSAAYSMVVRLPVPPDPVKPLAVPFDGGEPVIVTNHAPYTWAYYQVEVPTNALGWDVRLVNVSNGTPKVVIRRELLPSGTATSPTTWKPDTATNWPSGNQWAADKDWTGARTKSATGSDESRRILAMGMGRPLEPGVYILGVYNESSSAAASYTLVSRGIGPGWTIPVTELSFTNGIITVSNLPPREAAYFSVLLPTNCPGWKVKLTPTSGEAMLVVLKDALPSVSAGKVMQTPGNEHYILLPTNTTTSALAPGRYYLAVVGEGVNPGTDRVGTGSSDFTLESLGSPSVDWIGEVGPNPLTRTAFLEGGESAFYQVGVPPGSQALEFRLEAGAGNPWLTVVTNRFLPDPGAGTTDSYGNEGGLKPIASDARLITLPLPTQTVYTVAVKALKSDNDYRPLDYTLWVRTIPAVDLNFASEMNTNGLSHTTRGSLLDNQRVYYRVAVPSNHLGSPILGWELDLQQTNGTPQLRVRKDIIPNDAVNTGTTAWLEDTAVIAPPFLTNGTWFVEVRGQGGTDFTLTSRPVTLQRPAWRMPAIGETPATPGLLPPEFGDTGLDMNGVALPSPDRGIDLERGGYHFYAVVVPTNNAGLLRTRLENLDGKPILYLRTNAIPTKSHKADGQSGDLKDRSLTGGFSQQGNWVPLNGKTESQLTPGLWYLAVYADSKIKARYRLVLSTGSAQNLAAQGGAVSDQTLSEGDWRYYRVQLPTNLVTWKLTFAEQRGDVVVHLRDQIPPGNGVSSTDYKDWDTDKKQAGQTYIRPDSPGTYSLTVPPLLPGAVYYIGVRARGDSTFSLNSSLGGLELPPEPPRFSLPRLEADGRFCFNLEGSPNSIVTIQTSTNLTVWVTIGTITNGSGTAVISDSTVAGSRQRFFRALVQ